MPSHHQDPEDAPGDPDGQSNQAGHGHQIAVATGRPLGEGLVPGVAFVDDAREPVVDRPDQDQEAEPGPLREVAELVGEDPGEFLEAESGRQRQTDREDQLIAEDAEYPAVAVSGRVDLAVDLDPTRPRADRSADPVDEREEERLDLGVEDARCFSPWAGRAKSGLSMKATTTAPAISGPR